MLDRRFVSRRFFLILFGAGLMLFGLFCFKARARADGAPPPPPAGSDLYPSIGNTKVRMVSEYVVMDIVRNSSYSSEKALVTANFLFQNQGEEEERMEMRFPMSTGPYEMQYELENNKEYCHFSEFPLLDDLKVWIDGEPGETWISYEEFETWESYLNDFQDPEYAAFPCWAHFDVVFPPGVDVRVRIEYSVSGYDRGGGIPSEVEFIYVLMTGSGWFDTIGRADIVVRLPYGANELNVADCSHSECSFSGSEVQWHFEDFEPDSDIFIRIVRPSYWQRVLDEMEHTREDPSDGEAWGRLARAYKQILIANKGYLNNYSVRGDELYRLSESAYQQAVSLLPGDAGWHYGYADLLCREADFGEFSLDKWYSCLEETHIVLTIDPDNESADNLLWYLFGDNGYGRSHEDLIDITGPEPNFLILTPTAMPTEVDGMGATNNRNADPGGERAAAFTPAPVQNADHSTPTLTQSAAVSTLTASQGIAVPGEDTEAGSTMPGARIEPTTTTALTPVSVSGGAGMERQRGWIYLFIGGPVLGLLVVCGRYFSERK